MRLRTVLSAKIHRAVVTAADLNYVGSIGIDSELMARTGIETGDLVSVWNLANGARIETYAMALEAGSGEIVVNGAAARLFQVGDAIIIVSFCITDEHVEPKMILVDERNRYLRSLAHGETLV